VSSAYLCRKLFLQMSGQDSSLALIRDTLSGTGDTVTRQVFASSAKAEWLLSPENGGTLLEKVPVFHPAWLFFYLLFLLGFFAWVRMYYGNIMSQTVQASTNFQVAVRMFKDKSLLQNQLDTILYVIYFLSMAYFLYFLEERKGMQPYGLQGVTLYLFNLALLTGIFISRVFLLNVLGSLFNQMTLFREYLYHIFIFNKLMGILILPMLLFVVYTRGILQEVVIWASLAGIGAVMIMRIIRGIAFSLKKDISIFYMFLYLCALEISPLVLLYRWLEGIL
jgi:hypothetical protein